MLNFLKDKFFQRLFKVVHIQSKFSVQNIYTCNIFVSSCKFVHAACQYENLHVHNHGACPPGFSTTTIAPGGSMATGSQSGSGTTAPSSAYIQSMFCRNKEFIGCPATFKIVCGSNGLFYPNRYMYWDFLIYIRGHNFLQICVLFIFVVIIFMYLLKIKVLSELIYMLLDRVHFNDPPPQKKNGSSQQLNPRELIT